MTVMSATWVHVIYRSDALKDPFPGPYPCSRADTYCTSRLQHPK